MSERITRMHIISFILAALLASVFFSFILDDSFRRYETEARVVVIARSAAVAPVRDIAANMASFSETDEYRRLFFERLLKRRGVTGDEVSVDERIMRFENMVAVTPHRHGSTLSVYGYSDDPEMARDIAREAALSLFLFAGKYYNMKDEADFRIVGFLPERYGIGNPIPYVGASLSFGFGLVALVYLIVFSIPFRREPGRKHSIPKFDRKIFTPRRPTAEAVFGRTEPLSRLPEYDGETTEEVLEEEEVTPSELEMLIAPVPEGRLEDTSVRESGSDEESVAVETMIEAEPAPEGKIAETDIPDRPRVTPEKKGAAPGNLPGGMTEAEEQFLNEFSFEEKERPAEPDEATEEVEPELGPETISIPEPSPTSHEDTSIKETEPNHEPSEEDYRRRLNELLKGS